LFVTRRIKPQRVYRAIDWSLLLLFVGLFVVVAALERAVLTPDRLAHVRDLPLNQTLVLALITAILSNLVSNVPAVLVLKPLIAHLADPRHGWLVLGMPSTDARTFFGRPRGIRPRSLRVVPAASPLLGPIRRLD
jgi:Na+/H+ antiporter NhaD/arsenite permease-like protein